MRKPKMMYSDIEGELRTGDIFLARGLRLVSRFIETVSGSNWSHSGMVIRPEDIGMNNYPENAPLLWESTNDRSVPDLLTGESKTGPMLVPLRERIKEDAKSGYYKVFGIRYLQVKRDDDDEMFKRLKDVVNDPEVQGAEFPSYRSMVWQAVSERFFGGAQAAPKATFVCSELLTYTLQHMGLMPWAPVPASYVPKDYSAKGYAPFRRRATLGPEIYLGTKLGRSTPPLVRLMIHR